MFILLHNFISAIIKIYFLSFHIKDIIPNIFSAYFSHLYLLYKILQLCVIRVNDFLVRACTVLKADFPR